MAKKILTVAELTRKAGKLGGKARMESMSESERKEFARKGGLTGGKARAKKLSAERRSEIARKAVLARWARKTSDKTGPK